MSRTPVIGLALGSGSARGWAHIGVIQGLEELGIQPQVVAGTSIGALVGAVYVSDQLDAFADWVQGLTSRDVFGLLDFTLAGGLVKGERLFSFFREKHHNPDIESLQRRFVTVATEMKSGREVWIRHGPVLRAARASCALPGVFSPVRVDDRWMLDGGLVNPVPVSACRALGADIVIAVNLNAQLVGTHMPRHNRAEEAQAQDTGQDPGLWEKMASYFISDSRDEDAEPGLLDVVSASINIMQDRITRSRMAGDPAEISLLPQLEDFALMDFHRAKEAIEEGRALVHRRREEILSWVGQPHEPLQV